MKRISMNGNYFFGESEFQWNRCMTLKKSKSYLGRPSDARSQFLTKNFLAPMTRNVFLVDDDDVGVVWSVFGEAKKETEALPLVLEIFYPKDASNHDFCSRPRAIHSIGGIGKQKYGASSALAGHSWCCYSWTRLKWLLMLKNLKIATYQR